MPMTTRGRYRHFALGPMLWRSIDRAETKPPLERTAWEEGVVTAGAFVDNNRSPFAPILAVVFAVVGALVAPGPWYVRAVVAALLALFVSWLVPTLVAGLAALHAPYAQRDAARAAVPLAEAAYQGRLDAATRAHAHAMKAVQETYERKATADAARIEAERKAFDDAVADRERIRGLLGEAEKRIAELEDLGVADVKAKVAGAKIQLGTELRDIRHKIEIVRATRPHPHYSANFALPAFRWDDYDELLAVHAPDLYPAVESAYTAAHHVNSALDMRRTRANPGQTLGVIGEDGLDEAYEASGKALDALGEERGDVWESPGAGAEAVGGVE